MVWVLTAAEEQVQDAAVTGLPVDLKGSGITDPSVRASWLVELITGRTEAVLHPKGLDLRGARIIEQADWQARKVTYPLAFTRCTFEEALVLGQAELASLSLNDCFLPALQARQLHTLHDLSVDSSHIPGGLILCGAQIDGHFYGQHAELGTPAEQPGTVCLDGDNLHVKADMIFIQVVAHGEFRLSDARMQGGLDFSGAQLHNRGGSALNAERLNVQVAVVFDAIEGDGRFTADGQVTIAGAHIVGPLLCRGGNFSYEGGPALTAAGAKIGGDVVLDDGFTATGGVDLTGAEVGGVLRCLGSFVEDRNPGGFALAADRVTVHGDVRLDRAEGGPAFTAEGAVRFAAAQVGGLLSCSGGSFNNQGSAALIADDAKIGGDAFLDQGFSASGQVSFYDATVSNLICVGGRFSNSGGFALAADRITVRGNVRLDQFDADTAFAAEGQVRFAGAQIGGQLNCSGGNFSSQGGTALTAAEAKIGSDVLLGSGFIAIGVVDMSGVQVGGRLSCTGGSFSNENGTALDVAGAKINDHAVLGNGFTAVGRVSLSAAEFGGMLDCRNGKFRVPANAPERIALLADRSTVKIAVLLDHLSAEGQVRFPAAQIGGQLSCTGGSFSNEGGVALTVADTAISADALLNEEFTAAGMVDLSGIQVGRELNCAGGSFTNQGGMALTIAGGKIGGSALLNGGFTAAGTVDLSSTEMGGKLNCIGGSFLNNGAMALVADDAKIGSDAILGGGFSASGQVSFYDATVSNLFCTGGKFSNPSGFALVADRVTVRGNVRLDRLDENRTFTAEGAVQFAAAQVGGQLSCSGGSFSSQHSPALSVAGGKIGGSAFLNGGFTAAGAVDLSGTQVGGQLNCAGGSISNKDNVALAAADTTIGGDTVLGDGFTAAGAVDLSGTQVGRELNCNGGSFANEGGLALIADDAKIGSDAILGGGFTARGVVRLYDAVVSSLVCSGGEFKNPGGVALVADRVTIRGNVRLDRLDENRTFTAEGEARFAGAQIGGQLNCSGGSFSNQGGPALTATGVKVAGDAFLDEGFSAQGAVSLLDASVGNLSCTGGNFRNPGGRALVADRVTIRGNVRLDRLDENRTFTAEGEVRFADAQVGGQLGCSGGSFTNRGGVALTAAGAKVGSDAFLGGGFTAVGMVDLSSSEIGGQLNCAGGKFRQKRGTALAATGMKIGGDAYLGAGFSARGLVSLFDTSVGNLVCAGGRFHNPRSIALGADRVTVRRNMLLSRFDADRTFIARGQVRFAAAQVGGQLNCNGGNFSNNGDAALLADDASISGDAFLGRGFSAQGMVSLSDASVGKLVCTGGRFTNPGSIALGADRITVRGDVQLDNLQGGPTFNAEGALSFVGAQVGGEFRCCPEPEGINGTINLRSASLGVLTDNTGGRATPTVLDGLTCKALQPGPLSVGAAERIAWLQRNPEGDTTETYVKLAALYRADGYDELARKVLVANQKRRRRGRIARAWGWLLWVTVGYGYYPWLALAWLVVLLAAGTVTFELMPRSLFQPTSGAPPFQPFLYTVNVLVPFVSTQQDKWVAHGAAQWVSFAFVAVGWVFATVIISAFTGVLRRGD